MASRVCARTLLGSRILQNASRSLATTAPSSKIDPNYLSTESMDIEELFLKRSVRQLLRQLTGFELERIFAKRKQEFTVPKYKLLTDAQLKESYANAMRRADRRLQMPPVMRKRLPCEKVLRKDPAMQGAEKHNIIFTDISFGYTDRFRPIVVRQPDGVLRTATWEERDRMLQTYLTRPYKEIITPTMFSDPHFTSVLNKGWYMYVLDRACVQFEPDDEHFIDICHRTYDHINEKAAFDVLRSSRHFGPMCFYYAVTKNGDALVLDLLKTNRLDDAAAFVKLLHIVHPGSRSAELVSKQSSSMEIVEAYVKLEAKSKVHLERALDAYHDVAQEATA